MISHSIEGLSDGGLRKKIARIVYRAQLGGGDDFTRTPEEWADIILALSAAPERVEGGGMEDGSSSSPPPAASAKSQPNGERPNYRVMLRELMEAAQSVQDFWVVNWITARLADDDYESFVPHIFSPTEFGGDDCRICGCDIRSARHVRGAR